MKALKAIWEYWKTMWFYVKDDEPELTSEWIELDINKTCYKNGRPLPYIPQPSPAGRK